MWGRTRQSWKQQDPLTRRDAAIGTVVSGVVWMFFFSLPEGPSAKSIGLGLAMGLINGTGTLFWGWWGQRRRRHRE